MVNLAVYMQEILIDITVLRQLKHDLREIKSEVCSEFLAI